MTTQQTGLSDERIAALADMHKDDDWHIIPLDFARAIEKEVSAPLLERIDELQRNHIVVFLMID